MSLVSLHNVNYSYKRIKKDPVQALNDVSLSIDKGEFVSILGPNGSGKSTLLKIISGFLKCDSGDVMLFDKSIQEYSNQEIAKRIAYVPQSFNSSFPFSIYEIVAMGRNPHLGLFGFEKKGDHDKIEKVLSVLELEGLKSKGLNEVSGGEAQRAFIARALVQETDILLLDEPNAHLDLKHQYSIFEMLTRINNEKKLAVVAVSHDLNLSAQFSVRTVLLNNGQIIDDDKTQKVLTESNIRKIFEVNAKVHLENGSSKPSISIKSSRV